MTHALSHACLLYRDRLQHAARLLLAALALQLAACATPPSPRPVPADAADEVQAYLKRADSQAQSHDNVEVKVAVLRDAESQAVFELPLAEHGVQPVWVTIHNRSAAPLWFMPVFLDKDFFSAREVAYLFHGSSDDRRYAEIERTLTQRQIRVHVPPGATASGFVYTNLTRGIKLVNIELAGSHQLLRFAFARELPNGGFDFETVDVNKLYPRERQTELTVKALGAALGDLSCCTTDPAAKNPGDPLNLAIVGSEHDVLVALVRGGWDFTETTSATSVGRMVDSFITGALYRNSPVSPLHFEGRPQDFSMQRARSSISQRNHLRLWLTPMKVSGKPVWVGQISRDIGVRLTSKSPFLTTHKIDPDIDESRDYLLQDMLMTNALSGWGMAPGVGEASDAQPRENLTGDPYFTDGKRLVLFISPTPRAIPDVDLIEWEDASRPKGASD